ncbi:MAG: hypothetical protein WB764_26320 [Xanthobacteraceae bacterium]
MSSYQDTNWGYEDNTDAPETENPYPQHELDIYLAKLGYHRGAQDKYAPPWFPMQWEKPGSDPITLPPPHFKAHGFDQLVYDRNVITDLLLRLGGGGYDDDGHAITAKKKE